MKKLLTVGLSLVALGTTGAMAEKTFDDVFPVSCTEGCPAGWAITGAESTEIVPGGLKVTCGEVSNNDKTTYRADIKYNMAAESRDADFTMDASEHTIFAVSFIGSRPASGVLKLSNIKVNGSWIKNAAGYSLSETGFTDVNINGNHTYYWTIGGDNWTGNVTVNQIEIVVADIANEADRYYTVSAVNWFKDVDALKQALGTVENTTTGTKYFNLADAWNEAASGDALKVTADQTIDKRLDCGERSIVLEGEPGVKITRVNPANMMFLANKGSEYNLTLGNLILDGNDAESKANFIEASGSSSVTMNNVTVQNVRSSNALGLIVSKGGGALVLNGLTCNNNVVNANSGEVFFGSSYSKISGNNVCTISIEGTYNFTVADGVTNNEPIKIYHYNGPFTLGATVVKGCADTTKFVLAGTSDYKLEPSDGNLVVGQSTGVDGIDAESGDAAVYYNMQGVRVSDPENGLYIMVKDGKSSKVLVK